MVLYPEAMFARVHLARSNKKRGDIWFPFSYFQKLFELLIL